MHPYASAATLDFPRLDYPHKIIRYRLESQAFQPISNLRKEKIFKLV